MTETIKLHHYYGPASQKRKFFLCISFPCVSENIKSCINLSNGQMDEVKYKKNEPCSLMCVNLKKIWKKGKVKT